MKSAILKAREFRKILQAGDEDALASATLLQGVISGDVMAASFHVRQRLQRENLRLRRRLNMSRIKTEEAKRNFLEFEMQQRRGNPVLAAETYNRIRQLYGLEETLQRALPPAIDVEVHQEG